MLFHTFSWLPWIIDLVPVSLSRHTRRERLFLTSVPFVQQIFPGTAIFLSDTPSRTKASTLHILQTAYHQTVITAFKASLRPTTFIPNFFYKVLNENEGRTAFWFIPLWIQTTYCSQHNSFNICLQCYMYRFDDHRPALLHKNLQKFR
jgi:hypothetical protein